MAVLFKKTKLLEAQIEEYLDCVVRGALLFRQGVKYYLGNQIDDFEARLNDLDNLESHGDQLRRQIETSLYEHTLIPESRGDVLGLLESTDAVLNTMDETLMQFSVEIPEIIPELHQMYIELAEISTAAVEAMVLAIRSYFRDLTGVRDHINKVQFYENESDKIARKIKRIVFRKDLRLSHKIHMRYFAYHIENIADEAEDVTDRLAIATIKRYL
jgi:predicted phosphate transport protein (TIGR00153 family)